MTHPHCGWHSGSPRQALGSHESGAFRICLSSRAGLAHSSGMKNNFATYDRLVDAGAPALPSNRFYRIKDEGDGWLRLEIREHRQRFGSDRLAYRRVNPARYAPGRLLSAVVAALRSANTEITLGETVEALLGDAASRGSLA